MSNQSQVTSAGPPHACQVALQSLWTVPTLPLQRCQCPNVVPTLPYLSAVSTVPFAAQRTGCTCLPGAPGEAYGRRTTESCHRLAAACALRAAPRPDSLPFLDLRH